MSIGIGIAIPFIRRRGGEAPFVGLLDLYPNAAAAYSLRKLRAAYSGSAVRIRRSSDNAESDIGFLNNEFDIAAAQTFCGAGNGFITTWYDQSGNGRNATQATAVRQPQIVSGGTIFLQGTKPIVKFTETNHILNTSAFSLGVNRTYIMNMYNYNNNAASFKVYLGAVAGGLDNFLNGINGPFAESNIVKSYIGSGLANNSIGVTPMTNNSYQLLEAYVQGSVQHQHYRNGSLNAQNTSLTISPLTTAQVNSILATFATNELGTNESIIYDSYEIANRVGIENNINNYYGTY
jgi:hypothetical protein